jgi:hypothetical protein
MFYNNDTRLCFSLYNLFCLEKSLSSCIVIIIVGVELNWLNKKKNVLRNRTLKDKKIKYLKFSY